MNLQINFNKPKLAMAELNMLMKVTKQTKETIYIENIIDTRLKLTVTNEQLDLEAIEPMPINNHFRRSYAENTFEQIQLAYLKHKHSDETN